MTEKKYSFDSIKAIVGLGNPGPRYETTRHNIGFLILDALADRYGAQWQKNNDILYAQAQILDENGMIDRTIFLVKPQTFMNTSGKAMPFLVKKGIKADEIIVVHDELEKGFGKLAIRLNGSPRGHNGLRSIQGVIGKDFWRLRFGIDRPTGERDVGNYVLAQFTKEQFEELPHLIDQAVRLIEGG